MGAVNPNPGGEPPAGLSRAQYAALPCRYNTRGELEILLVTSRRSGRWIIPKGWPIEGLPPHLSAAREAMEEAGVTGAASEAPIGIFQYDKVLERRGQTVPCDVTVFMLLVEHQHPRWKEKAQRRTQWVPTERAVELVTEPGLKAIVSALKA